MTDLLKLCVAVLLLVMAERRERKREYETFVSDNVLRRIRATESR